MPSFETTIPSGWDQARTFDYLADFRSVAEWDPSMTSATLVAGTAGEVGARYELVMSTLGRESTLVYEAVAVERPHRVQLRCETDSLVSVDTITVAAGQDGVQVTYDAQLELKGLKATAEPALQVGLVLAGERAKKTLASTLAQP
ncbi:MAG: Polyketide cyclase/dehydrase [Frankiales bacterium]|nr:Polyketide cyclase/dehydrase [Frankiales bacterium]